MTRLFRKVASIVVAAGLLMSAAAGCGGSGREAEGTSGGTASAGQAESSLPAEKAPEPITFTAFSSDTSLNTKWGEDPVSRKITELTGVTLDIEFLVGNLNEKIGVMLASGDYPDLMLSITHENIAQLAQANVLVPMEDYIEKYGVNVKKIFGDKIGAMKNEMDGKIYGFNREFNGQPTKSPVNMQIQYAMLKEAGYPKITTLDDLYGLIRDYKAKHPEYEGKSTIGLAAWGDSWGFGTTFNNAALRASGYQDDGNFHIDSDTLQAKYGLTTDAAKLYLKWLNKMNKEGLFDKDSFVQKDEAFQAKLISGRVLAASNAWWNIEQAEAALKKAGKEDRCYAKLPVYVSAEAAEKSRISYYDPLGSWKSVITDHCKDPERAFKFFDQMWSEEMQVICNWGVEGESYTVDASGKRVMKPDYLNGYFTDDTYVSRTGIKAYYYWSCGPMVKDSSGQYLDPFTAPEIEASQYTDMDKEVLHAYKADAITWVDLSPKPEASPWGFAWKLTLPGDSEGAIAQNKVENEIQVNAVVKMVGAKSDDEFEQGWQSFLKQCKDAGIEKREAEINDALKKRMDLWYK